MKQWLMQAQQSQEDKNFKTFKTSVVNVSEQNEWGVQIIGPFCRSR